MSSELNKISKFIQENSPDDALNHAVQGKDFLQSEEWNKFQESVGRKTYSISSECFYASVIEHQLSVVGKYFYIPRGPITLCSMKHETFNTEFQKLISLAKRENAGWIRFDANNSSILDLIRKNWRVIKAPHDMQPREILVIDITKPEEQLLSEMKPKTRYNIKIAQKKEVIVRLNPKSEILNPKQIRNSNEQNSKFYIDKFIELVKITAERDKITPHPESYYRKMFETIPPEILKLYVAEYEDGIIAANIVIFYGKTAIYLHGASDNEYRNVMAPYLLQWQAMLDAKKEGFARYDLGGIKSCNMQHETCNKKWAGITRFKTGFTPNAELVRFPGSYDIIISEYRYKLYRLLQRIKKIL